MHVDGAVDETETGQGDVCDVVGAEVLERIGQGELAMAGESWRCDDADELALDNLHIQQIVRARCGAEEGIGVLEQAIMGPHAGYGLQGYMDPAPG